MYALRCVLRDARPEPRTKDRVNRLIQISADMANSLSTQIGMPDNVTLPAPNMDDPVLTRLADIMAAMGDPETPPNVVELLDPVFRWVMFERAMYVARMATDEDYRNWYLKVFSNNE